MQTTPSLEEKAIRLVTERITGHRSGLPHIPTSTHSLRVYGLVKEWSVTMQLSTDCGLAALLHDILEDGGVTTQELAVEGFTARTIELVELCSHEETDLGSEARWTLMIAKLIKANDREAWAIKVADLLDNLKESSALGELRQRFMVGVKAELLLRLTAGLLQNQPLWLALAAEARYQAKSLLPLDGYWTEQAPYIVYSEDHADYYEDPPVRPKVGEFSSYVEAVDFCRERVRQGANGEEKGSISYWIAPQPAGLTFSEHEFLGKPAKDV